MHTNKLLEHKIKEHAEELFGSEPLKGHRSRFADKLQTVSNKKQIPLRNIIIYLSVAAIFAGVIIFIQPFQSDDVFESEPLSEVQAYYSMQLQEKIDEIELLIQQNDAQDREELMSDMESMQREAEANIRDSNDKNIDLIVMTYSTRIETLQHIQHLLASNY